MTYDGDTCWILYKTHIQTFKIGTTTMKGVKILLLIHKPYS